MRNSSNPRRVPHGFVFLLLALITLPLPQRVTKAQSGPVRAVLFTSPTCTFCQEIVHQQLPPLIHPFGEQLQMLYVNVETEAGQRLYQVALETFHIPRGIPLVLLGEDWLMGVNIPKYFPELVEKYLAQGGVDWPSLPGLEEYLATESLPSTPTITATVPPTVIPPSAVLPDRPIVRAVLFWMSTCPHCHEVLENVLPPLQKQYGDRLEIWLLEVRSEAEIDLLYRTAERYGLSSERIGVPFLVIGEHVLIGANQIPDQLPALIENYLAQGGVDWPPGLIPPAEATFFSLLPVGEPTAMPTPPAASIAAPPSTPQPSGFGLAMATLVVMILALLYSLIAFTRGRTFRLPAWADWSIPIALAAGILVASYLSYVEIRMTEAICGPVGDCNAVQSSPYARLFGVLPVGVLGLGGYLALLVAWVARRLLPSMQSLAARAFFAMSLFGVTFSIYLTYLEMFVIRAVCLWCLASAFLMTVLLLLGLPPAVESYVIPKSPRQG